MKKLGLNSVSRCGAFPRTYSCCLPVESVHISGSSPRPNPIKEDISIARLDRGPDCFIGYFGSGLLLLSTFWDFRMVRLFSLAIFKASVNEIELIFCALSEVSFKIQHKKVRNNKLHWLKRSEEFLVLRYIFLSINM